MRKYLNTSANTDGMIYDAICFAAEKYNLSQSAIFKDLIMMMLSRACAGRITGRLTEYQNHSPERWETLYYSLDDEQNEIFSAARQRYKISISKLAYVAFLFFWKDLIRKYEEFFKKEKCNEDFNSYDRHVKNNQEFIENFKKRLEIIQLE